jgi:hypothetical protein
MELTMILKFWGEKLEQTNLTEASKENCGPKGAVLPLMIDGSSFKVYVPIILN